MANASVRTRQQITYLHKQMINLVTQKNRCQIVIFGQNPRSKLIINEPHEHLEQFVDVCIYICVYDMIRVFLFYIRCPPRLSKLVLDHFCGTWCCCERVH